MFESSFVFPFQFDARGAGNGIEIDRIKAVMIGVQVLDRVTVEDHVRQRVGIAFKEIYSQIRDIGIGSGVEVGVVAGGDPDGDLDHPPVGVVACDIVDPDSGKDSASLLESEP